MTPKTMGGQFIFPEGPGDRIAGAILGGRTPDLKDLAAAGGYKDPITKGAELLKSASVWLVIIAVGLIGLWGLLSPGGGVAIIERARK